MCETGAEDSNQAEFPAPDPVGSSGAPPVGQKLPSPKSNKNLLADCELFVKVTCVPPPSKSKVVTSATKLGTGNGVVTTTFAVCIEKLPALPGYSTSLL